MYRIPLTVRCCAEGIIECSGISKYLLLSPNGTWLESLTRRA